ncbi:MAG: HAD family hydrolase [Rhodospirillales bacterium]
MERFAKVDTLIVDKTGTLTQGKPKLVAVLPEEGHDEAEVLRLAASLERGSEHPLAEAIVSGAEERGVEFADVEDFEAVTGKGVKGKVDGKAVALGNAKLVADPVKETTPAALAALHAEGFRIVMATLRPRRGDAGRVRRKSR